jgi:hypothetical protein
VENKGCVNRENEPEAVWGQHQALRDPHAKAGSMLTAE